MRNDKRRSNGHCDVGRRRALRAVAAAAGWAALGRNEYAVAQPPKEAGLSYEGLLKGQSGFQPRSPMKLAFTEIPGFLSKTQLSRCYAVYRAGFDELLAAESELTTAPRDASHLADYGALRARQIRAANSVLLHEFYFRNLAPAPVAPSRYILGNVDEHMGTLDSWRNDFAACARIADAWAVLAYDPYDDRWHDLPLGEADAGGMAGGNPLVVCDVSAAAWSGDYSDRAVYVDRFLDHVDWNVVAARYRAVDRQ